ncbi:MAG: hypothetical protein MJY82_04910 [Fibrobacter sp.]|nr:hypothetical protein [Fibrobacter sp.]
MVFRNWVILCIMVCALVGCSPSYHWSKSHPMYQKAPYSELAIAGTSEAFVLTRSSWFAKKFKWSPDSIQLKATAFCKDVFLNELRRAYPSFEQIPDANTKNFPEESQKLDSRIFMKGRLPEQGVMVKDSSGKTPPYILLLHEFIVGTDLNREDYFDYARIHLENTSKKTSKNLSAIVSYTLWDNNKQRPLFSAVDEIQRPISTPTPNDLEALVRSAVKQIRVNLYEGARK